MGIDYDAELIIGWKLDNEKVDEYLKNNNLESWEDIKTPNGSYFVRTYPCPDGDEEFYLTLYKQYSYCRLLVKDFHNLFENKEEVEEFVKNFTNQKEITIMAVPHIW